MGAQFIDPRTAVPCRTVAFTPDGKYLVEANYLGFITIRSTIDGKIYERFLGQTALVETIRIEPQTNLLFLVGAGFEGNRDFGVIKIFEIPSGSYVGEIQGHSDDITDITFLHGNKRLLVSVALDKSVIVHDLENNTCFWKWDKYSNYLNMCSARPNHEFQFAVIGDAAQSYVLDANKQNIIAELYTPGDSNGLIWSPDGRYLIIGDDHSVLQYFDSLKNWDKIYETKIGGAVKRTFIDPFFDNRGIAASYDGKLWSFSLYPPNNAKDIREPFVIRDKTQGLWGINVAATKTHIAVPSFCDRAYLFKRDNKGFAADVVGDHPNPTYGANWVALSKSKTNSLMAISHDDGFLRFRCENNGSFAFTLGGDTKSLFMGCTYHPTLPIISVIDFYGEIFVYDYEDQRLLQRYQLPFGPGISLDFSPCGNYLVAGGYRWDPYVLVFDPNSCNITGHILLDKPNKSVVKNVIFNSHNDIVIAAADGSVIYYSYSDSGKWDMKLHIETTPSMELCNGVAFCEKRNVIYAVSRDQTIRAFDSSNGKQIAIGYGHTRSVKSVCVSTCTNYVITSSYDRTILIWNADTLKAILPPLRNANAGVSCVREKNGHIYSCSFDGFVCCWELANGRLLWGKDSFDSYTDIFSS
jgi:WD40 repeat protein